MSQKDLLAVDSVYLSRLNVPWWTQCASSVCPLTFSYSSLFHSVFPSCTRSVNTFSISSPAVRDVKCQQQLEIGGKSITLLCVSLWWQLGGRAINFQCDSTHLKAQSMLSAQLTEFHFQMTERVKSVFRPTESDAEVQQLQCVRWDPSMPRHVLFHRGNQSALCSHATPHHCRDTNTMCHTSIFRSQVQMIEFNTLSCSNQF